MPSSRSTWALIFSPLRLLHSKRGCRSSRAGHLYTYRLGRGSKAVGRAARSARRPAERRDRRQHRSRLDRLHGSRFRTDRSRSESSGASAQAVSVVEMAAWPWHLQRDHLGKRNDRVPCRLPGRRPLLRLARRDDIGSRIGAPVSQTRSNPTASCWRTTSSGSPSGKEERWAVSTPSTGHYSEVTVPASRPSSLAMSSQHVLVTTAGRGTGSDLDLSGWVIVSPIGALTVDGHAAPEHGMVMS